MPDERPKADVTVAPGTNMVPPRDMGDVPPAPTGRVKSPENPVPPGEAKASEHSARGEKPKAGEPEVIVVVQTIARDEWREFVSALPIYFSREMVLQTCRDYESLRPLGLEIVNIGGYARLAAFGLRAGDILTRLGETELRGQTDVDAALKQSFRDAVELELWRGDDRYRYRFEPGEARLPRKSEK